MFASKTASRDHDTTDKRTSPRRNSAMTQKSSNIDHNVPPTTPVKDTRTRRAKILSRKSEFVARPSRLDTWNMMDSVAEFRGFFILFWVVIGYWLLNTAVLHWREFGVPFRLAYLSVFNQDLLGLLISEVVIVSVTFVSVPIQQALAHGYLGLRSALVLKHLFQTSFIVASVVWTFQRPWHWPQTACFCLHAMTLYMKMHSYMTTNHDFEKTSRKLKALTMNWNGDVASSTTAVAPETAPRKRHSVDVNGATNDENLAEIEALQKNLTMGQTSYPENLTYSHFMQYLMFPVCVYELEYPRNERVRPWFVLEKGVAIVGILTILYLILEHNITPVMHKMHQFTFVEAILDMLVPMLLSWILIFYLVFDCICNFFAEITRFADREFYADWWNSLNYEEFNRKWNKPVHEWLLRHWYLESMANFNFSKSQALWTTFLFSAFVHELAIYSVTKSLKGFFFLLQMSQMLWMIIGQVLKLKRWPALANAVFWLSFFFGFPMAPIMYTKDHFATRAALESNTTAWSFWDLLSKRE